MPSLVPTLPSLPGLTAPVDERYPRPDLVREGWTDLCGVWSFAYDDDDRGRDERWESRPEAFDREIVVPYPPESALSGLGDEAAHPVVWYRRTVEVPPAAPGERLVLHFGAVDHRASVWVDGRHLGGHEGGHTPFSFDVTDVAAGTEMTVVVRAEDPVDDPAQPRGKQTWLAAADGLFHPRTTGVWQPVWLERRPALAVEHLTWTPDVAAARVRLAARLTAVPASPVHLSVTLRLGDEVLAEQVVRVAGASVVVDVAVPAAADARRLPRLLWSPESPTLLEADVRLLGAAGELDRVRSSVGLRSVAVADGAFLLNGRPYPLRAVLEQGFWPQSHLAAPSPEALRREVELIKELGFNAVRVHQKVEDPRFLHWCDRLGLLVWAELPSAFAFTPTAVRRLTAEWLEVLDRDASHPCIVTWVPLNESWGVPHAAEVDAQRAFAVALAALTRAVDGTRPVVSNDGWEHADSDIIGVHDYSADPLHLLEHYGDRASLARTVADGRPWRRRVSLPGHPDRGQPVVLSEFGGISWAAPGDRGAWGYTSADDADDLLGRLRALFGAVHASSALAGSCYTQLTDTATETNGLLDAHRRPKLPVALLREVVTGQRPAVPAPSAPVELVRTAGG